jgi:putative oxidoreductase
MENIMEALSIAISLGVRLALVLLFLPFSALDKILDFRGAIAQAEQDVASRGVATALIATGLFIEVIMSAGVLTGIADRAAAFVLALYCGATALLWKQFWRPGDFWEGSHSRGRALFWDFWKNIALAGGFLLITFGTSAATVAQFFANPLSSTHPYAVHAEAQHMNENTKQPHVSDVYVPAVSDRFKRPASYAIAVRFDSPQAARYRLR